MGRCVPSSRKVVVSEQFPSLFSPHTLQLKGLAEPAKSPANSNSALTSNIISAVFVLGKSDEKQFVGKGLGKLQHGSQCPREGETHLTC